MTLREDAGRLALVGICPVEEAEALVARLQAGGVVAVDLAQCRQLHSALAQALIACAAPIEGESADPFLRDHLAPALAAAVSASPEGQPTRAGPESEPEGQMERPTRPGSY